ncbi:hypothetical protein L7F22_032099, partial [Adiantum nelumboides]|nr:hypothetical protein [Adiantum nelumboides]
KDRGVHSTPACRRLLLAIHNAAGIRARHRATRPLREDRYGEAGTEDDKGDKQAGVSKRAAVLQEGVCQDGYVLTATAADSKSNVSNLPVLLFFYMM